MRTLPVVSAALLCVLVTASCASGASAIRASAQEEGAPPPVFTTPRAPKAVDPSTLTYLVEVEGLALFEDERHEARELLAAWAQEHGLRIVPPAKAGEVLSRARRGAHARTGEACGRPLAPFLAKERWRSALGADGVLRAWVSCDKEADACHLRLTARDRLGWDAKVLLEREAPFAREKPWREALASALPALVEPSGDDRAGGVGGLLGALAGGVVEARPERLGFSVWQARETDRLEKDALKDGLTFPKGNAPLRACFADDSAGGDLLLDVDASGRVARCESRGADDELARCACEAFQKHASARPALRSRRLNASFHFTPADVVTPANGVVTASVRTHFESGIDRRGGRVWRTSVSDRSIDAWRPPADDAIERCFADVDEPGQRGAVVDVRFDAKGDVVNVDVRPNQKGLSDAQRECVARVFTTAKAPCPAVDGASARAEVTVTVRRIGEQIGSPFEGLRQESGGDE